MRGVKFPPTLGMATVWVVWLFMAIGVLGWALFVLLDAFDAKKDAAAWVQAVGSVLAIIVAIAVANEQNQRAFRAAKQAERELLQKLNVVANTVADASNNASKYLRNNSGDRLKLSQFEVSVRGCDNLMREVQFKEVPGAEAAIEWLALRAAVGDLLHNIQVIQQTETGKVSMTVIYDMESAAERVDKARHRVCAACGG